MGAGGGDGRRSHESWEHSPRVSLRAIAVTTKDKMPESGFTFDVTVATADGSATQPADYQQLSDTATFNRSDFSLATISGQRRYRAVKTFTVRVTHDTLLEPNETFTVTLNYADPSLPYLQGGRDTATVTITDDISSTVDLSTTVFGSPFRVSRGEELTYDYTVTNSGPAVSTNTVVRSTLDRGVSFVSATPADKCAHSGGATGGVVACTFDTLDAGASEAGEIVVQVGPAASADIAITSIATGGELDRRPADNTAADSTELVAPPEQVSNLSPIRERRRFHRAVLVQALRQWQPYHPIRAGTQRGKRELRPRSLPTLASRLQPTGTASCRLERPTPTSCAPSTPTVTPNGPTRRPQPLG